MSDLRNPLQRARGLGSAKSGANHWWMQRMTAVALVVLGIWFVITLLSLMHADFATAHATLAKPWNAVLMIAFTTSMFWHAQLGLQVVIEDYVHTRWLEVSLMVLVKLLAVLFALACALAVLRVALGA
ncbi:MULTISPECIES: succinate dehydrogenase, hydrophobic membrane anchor protein [Oleiagrimonas]|uniref:Succinate dehydrogenase hydrophobic membrane anchor subunit n=1 Tax=Oleiagrimonas citrea TaxID=1665687 RepID=A0A846ZE92_9GAMM|nr:succinate dehydrogenase, hydrophobic membrane anchor protein [Oleiagrimonas sp. MCCC 1A03011]NKZ37524.1 succinate dehydrogenase, hydrophobic membrane anchor protein [Oleiagrimonas citrea]RAP58018.1 succinate dehydrogenase, hydrophobic membrane anchor protein [Oleiagrimonas sp. MCCC 1A03011]